MSPDERGKQLVLINRGRNSLRRRVGHTAARLGARGRVRHRLARRARATASGAARGGKCKGGSKHNHRLRSGFLREILTQYKMYVS
jgi:hypothetical protein